MRKICLLTKIFIFNIFSTRKTKILSAICIGLVLWMVIAFWQEGEQRVRVLMVDYDNSNLSERFYNDRSDKMEIHKTSLSDGLKALRNYEAEILVEIPEDASSRLLQGEKENIFSVYYLKDNKLATILMDRFMSTAMAEIFALRGNGLAKKLLIEHKPNEVESYHRSFMERVQELQNKMKRGYYFQIYFSQHESPEKDTFHLQFSLLIVSSLFAILILAVGDKLARLETIKSKVNLTGITTLSFRFAELLAILFLPMVCAAVLLPLALVWGQILFWKLLICFLLLMGGMEILLLSVLKEKKWYFSIGFGFYIVLIFLVAFQQWR